MELVVAFSKLSRNPIELSLMITEGTIDTSPASHLESPDGGKSVISFSNVLYVRKECHDMLHFFSTFGLKYVCIISDIDAGKPIDLFSPGDS